MNPDLTVGATSCRPFGPLVTALVLQRGDFAADAEEMGDGADVHFAVGDGGGAAAEFFELGAAEFFEFLIGGNADDRSLGVDHEDLVAGSDR